MLQKITLHKKITLHNREIIYRLRTSRRARRVCLTIYSGSELVVTKPWLVSERMVDKFIRKKAAWIIRGLDTFIKIGHHHLEFGAAAADYQAKKAAALAVISERVEHFNQFYNFSYFKITVRNQRTCWGSCSKKGNLNFNYRLLNLPAELRDYVIVHELCHLREFNHSPRFWDLVARVLPEHQAMRRRLKGKAV